jgi:acylphosphatase
LTVTGRVQGVGFRFFVLREAIDLQLDGWVANQPDGSVRCLAEGPRERLLELVDRLRGGPPGARVDDVLVAWLPARGGLGPFHVRTGWHSGD